MTESGGPQNQPDREWGARLLWVVLLVGLTTLLTLLVKGLYPSDLPIDQNPDFIDNIFDNRAVIWAARLLLVSAAVVLALGGVFIVASIVTRMRNREWLRRAGPFEVSETAMCEVENLVEFWRDSAVAKQEEIAELTERLNESRKLVEALQLTLDNG